MIATWSTGNPDQHMAEEILVDLLDQIPRHPWWRARAALTVALLERFEVRPPARVLDAGCGWGVTLDTLERRGYRATGLDVSRATLDRLDRPGRMLVEADLTRALPVEAERFDAVLALDVIEHLDDDRAALARLTWLVEPGAPVIVSVPAHPALFSEFDAIQGHRRRYLPETLREAFEGSGLGVERILWWGSWLLPILRRQRRRRRRRGDEPASATYRRYLALPRWPISAALRLGFALDHSRTLRGRSRDGTSLIAIARRLPPESEIVRRRDLKASRSAIR